MSVSTLRYKGNVFERVSPKIPKNNDIKKAEIKIEPKKLDKFNRNDKKRATWAPTTKKKLEGSIKCEIDSTKKNANENYGTNKTNKNNKMNKTNKIKKEKIGKK